MCFGCLPPSPCLEAMEGPNLLLSFTPWHSLMHVYVGVKFRNPHPAEQENKDCSLIYSTWTWEFCSSGTQIDTMNWCQIFRTSQTKWMSTSHLGVCKVEWCWHQHHVTVQVHPAEWSLLLCKRDKQGFKEIWEVCTVDTQPWLPQAGHSIVEMSKKSLGNSGLFVPCAFGLRIYLSCFHCNPCIWWYWVFCVSYLTQSYPSGAGRDGNDIKLKQRGRVNYSTVRKVMAQYWLKAWDLSTDGEAAEEKNTYLWKQWGK